MFEGTFRATIFSGTWELVIEKKTGKNAAK